VLEAPSAHRQNRPSEAPGGNLLPDALEDP
jgi:hypothetical protein